MVFGWKGQCLSGIMEYAMDETDELINLKTLSKKFLCDFSF